ncbi:DUF58 domain-containing protein [Neobacillus drentensis]|uniref:DUF58 domain-containing protein n=1 Tax=Neobacillus drentensis TaxID=220684 RepID=UPI002FFF4A0E
MIWNKYSVEDQRIPGISGVAIILIIVSIYIQSKLILFLAIFFLTIAFSNQLYLKRAGNQLYFQNTYEKKHFFVGEKGQWTLIFRNEGFPILKGELRIFFDHFVAPEGKKLEASLSMYEISIPVSLYKKQTKQIIIPFLARCRGTAKIRKLEFHVPSPFGFGETILESKNFLKQQAVVYPQPILVRGLKEQMSIHPRKSVSPISIFEDRLGPLGTRDYLSSDSFSQIHWKASARKQSLQSKIYEKISEKGLNIALNISNGHSITGDLEELISSLTELAYYAFNKQIAYSLCINVRSSGSTPFLFLPKGEGKVHLQKVLEGLASISTQNTSLSYEYMLAFYNRHLAAQPIFVHGGIRTEDTNLTLLSMVNTGTELYELKIEHGQGVLTKMEIHQESRVHL